MEFVGYIASICIGLSLGLLGGGGSILTVPILVFCFTIEPALATTYSLFIVGLTSSVGAFKHYKLGNIRFDLVALFGLPSLLAVLVMRCYLMPLFPTHLFHFQSLEVTKPIFLMTVFAVLMFLAALPMIKNQMPDNPKVLTQSSNFNLIFQGIFIGVLTGFVGIGGGFLIIPSLIYFTRISMKQAIGTSLTIITMSSLFGAAGDIIERVPINFSFLLSFTAFAVFGIVVGCNLSKKLDNSKLKPAFGWLVLFMGIFILIREYQLMF
ncbi:MAG: permease [Sphingobacteriales bacterium]|nr:permease [Sphingobacteriales bacterium]